MRSKGARAMAKNDGQRRTMVPKLRFPGFDHDWVPQNLQQVCTMQAGKFVAAAKIHERRADGLYPCFGGNGLRGYTASYTHDGKYPLIGRQGAQCGNVTFATGRFHATEHAVVASPKLDVDVDWLYYALDQLSLNQYATGQAQPGLSVDVLDKVVCAKSGDKNEQQKIANCLSSVDANIAAESRKLLALKAHKKGLMQQLFPAEGQRLPRLRFPGFSGRWKVKRMSTLVTRSMRRVTVEPDQAYQEIGIRSHGKGIFHKGRVVGKALGNKRVFWVTENALVLNIVFAWEQAVAVTSTHENGMIASHRFPMYEGIAGSAEVTFLKYLFLTTKGKELLAIASPGGAGRNKTLGQKEFEDLGVLIPDDVHEQKKIAACLSSVDDLIAVQSSRLAALRQHKKGLMQGLFPAMDSHAA